MDLLEISKNNSKNNQPFYVKMLSLFSVVRGYNILLIVIAQYLASIFIFSPEKITDINIKKVKRILLLAFISDK